MKRAIRALLVDDNEEFLESVVEFLAGDPSVEIVGFTTSASEALDFVQILDLDVVLMDLAMPGGMSGLEATRAIKRLDAPPKVVALTFHDGPHYQEAARAAGADALVPKSEIGTRLLLVLAALFDADGNL